MANPIKAVFVVPFWLGGKNRKIFTKKDCSPKIFMFVFLYEHFLSSRKNISVRLQMLVKKTGAPEKIQGQENFAWFPVPKSEQMDLDSCNLLKMVNY